MNKFYRLSKSIQWVLAIFFVLLGAGSFLGPFARPQLWYFLLFPFALAIMQFALTPLFTLLGVYKYYSPMLLVYNPNKAVYDLHTGTSFDYLMVMHWRDRGLAARQKIWCYCLQGLIAIAKDIEQGKLPKTIQVVGTSYFFSSNTAKRLGFHLTKPSLSYRINLLINALDLIWMYSFAQGKIAIPPLLKTQKAAISGDELLKQKPTLEQLMSKIEKRLS
ncbi:hypothetical protein [uncultured Microscilla sp.]|uniref:hypothetical protein n=1 Tax=uncultured Microscilla sp. TaxID=432653 RepID=UPI002623545A|nr:hypothetical protein [uncultured Microscilla sp.]